MKRGRVVALLLGLATLLAAPAHADDPEVLLLYPGFGTAQQGFQLDGRIVEARNDGAPDGQDGPLHNLWRSARQFFNDEGRHRPVRLELQGQAWTTQSDGEGYFSLHGDAASAALSPGWHRPAVSSGPLAGQGELLILPPQNTLGLVSDIDDTVLVSQVTDKPRLLANTFLKNPLQREAVPGVAALYQQVAALNPQPAAAPLFYLSASPRQMHGAISRFLQHNAFPPGVLLTKRVSNDALSDPLLDQFGYKTRRLADLLARLPGVRFVLVGDDGEQDPEIYDWLRRHAPGQVAAIWIRRVHPDPARPRLPGQADLAEVLARPADFLPSLIPTAPGATP